MCEVQNGNHPSTLPKETKYEIFRVHRKRPGESSRPEARGSAANQGSPTQRATAIWLKSYSRAIRDQHDHGGHLFTGAHDNIVFFDEIFPKFCHLHNLNDFVWRK